MATATVRLVGDIGGTNARFGLVDPGTGALHDQQVLACAGFPDLAAAARHYLDRVGGPDVREAAMAVASPVLGDQVRFTNSPWAFSIADTRMRLGLERLEIINDFTALALALPHLAPGETRQIGGGIAVAGAALALIGAGTGLGVSGLLPSAAGWVPVTGEGGHTAFSPVGRREQAVLTHLWQRFEHVSTERLLQGAGIVLLHETLCALDGRPRPALTQEDITRAACAGSDPVCMEVVDLFCGILGTASANLAVTLGARGGVFIGGGIVPSLGPAFDRSPFRARFEAKGRYRDYIAAIPTYVITAENPALRGVARVLATPRAA
jgi:glucokinase